MTIRLRWIAIVLLALRLDGVAEDCDQNGIDDAVDIASGAPDCDTNGVLDACQVRTFVQFSDLQDVSYPFSPDALAVGDVDGDGAEDLAFRNVATNDILFGINREHSGVFYFKKGLVATKPTSGLLVADVDLDGAAEIIATDSAGGTISVYAGLGSGTFAEPASFDAGPLPVRIAAHDLDGDSDLDLLVLSEEPGALRVFLLGADSQYGAGAVIPVDNSPKLLACGDFNRDGATDAAVAGPSSNELLIFLGDGAGSLTLSGRHVLEHPVAALAAGDLNRDRYADVVLASATSPEAIVGLSVGGADFTWDVTLPLDDAAVEVIVADVGHDGDPDVVVAMEGAKFETFENRGRAEFGNPHHYQGFEETTSIVWRDFDSDGNLELVTASRESGFLVKLTRITGASSAEILRFPERYGIVVALDLDDDGDLDVVTADEAGTYLNVLRNEGRDGLIFWGSYPTSDAGGCRVQAITAADLDRDGDRDLVIGCDSNRIFSTIENLGDCLLGQSVTFVTGSLVRLDPRSATPGDYDGDGDMDLAFLRTDRGLIHVLANDGAGAFTPVLDVPMISGMSWLASGDLDGDGDTDLLALDYSRNSFVIRNQGDGTFAPLERFPAATRTTDLLVADMDGDGLLDIVDSRRNDDSVCLRLNNGSGLFGSERCYSVYEPGDIAVDDLNDDGAMDLVVARDPGSSSVSGFSVLTVLLNRGHGVLEPAGEATLPEPHRYWLHSVNVDAEGRHGLTFSTPEQSGMALVHVVERQLGDDCNANGVPDACDISQGVLHDTDLDGVPDECARTFHRADPDQTDTTDVSDAVSTFRYLFTEGDPPECLDSADSNNDGQVDVSDGIFILRFLFLGQAEPPWPGFPGSACGPDTEPPGQPGNLGCDRYAPCGP